MSTMPSLSFVNEGGKILCQGGTVKFNGPTTINYFQTFVQERFLSGVEVDEDDPLKGTTICKTAKITSKVISHSDGHKNKATAAPPIVVSFGENNSYYLSITLGDRTLTRSKNIPESMEPYLPDGEKGVARIRWLSLGPNGTFFMTYETENGNIKKSSNIKNEKIMEWVDRDPVDYSGLKVTFGPSGSFSLLQLGEKGMRLGGVPDDLLKANKARDGCPTLVALGTGESYIATWADGDSIWGGVDYRLWADLKEAKEEGNKIVCAVLSPYNDNYYVQFANGKVSYSISGLDSEMAEATGRSDNRWRRMIIV